ncbi:MAG: type II secretion system protein [Planctomycetes bacterium]|nr:type II secretion system protein [Planctomycetota bacterium]
MQRHGSARLGFTLIELLVVIAVMSILMAILVPALHKVRFHANETACLSNLRQINIALMAYANEDARTRLPLEPTEHNPHPALLTRLGAYGDEALLEAFYCPQARHLEANANDPNGGTPTGSTDSLIDTPENRRLGNIMYIYWSFRTNKPGVKGGTWRDTSQFLPRQLTLKGSEVRWDWLGKTSNTEYQTNQYWACTLARPGEIWVLSDFFRKGGIFPHGRKGGPVEGGVNVSYLDGHVGRVYKQPKDSYR